MARPPTDFVESINLISTVHGRQIMPPYYQSMSCEGACEIHSGQCAGCACVRPFFGRAMCDRTFAHFLGQNCHKMLLFALETILELKCPIPF